MDNVILTTERTEMKFPLDLINANDIVRAIGDEETVRFMDSVPNMTYTQDDALRFMSFLEYTRNSTEDLQLGIFEKESSLFIGMCTLEAIDNKTHTCELGYWLNKSFVGKGFMYECASALIRYAKDELGIKTVNAFVITNHSRSISLLQRLRFIEVGRIPNDTENKGQLVDRYKYELNL